MMITPTLAGFLVLVFSFGLEFSVYLINALWAQRRLLAPTIIFLTSFASGLLLFSSFHILWFLLLGISGYRSLNLLRINKNRMNPQHLRKACLASGQTLMAAQLLIVAVWLLAKAADGKTSQVIFGLAAIQLMAALAIFISTLVNIKNSRLPKNIPDLGGELPTLSVAVPARNETTDLIECLESLLASDYPKLEILVLDDCSQAQTSDIIRKFAHSGVRFIKGHEPKTSWLAKNQAYDRLSKEASGQLLLFCGVDLRVGKKTLSNLVTLADAQNAQMLSILPLSSGAEHQKGFFTPLLRWWELALPRFVLAESATSRSCWIINKQTLNKFGGFAAASRSIFPEKYFAGRLARTNQYKFYNSDHSLELTTTKTNTGQWRSAMRLRYFQTHRRPDGVALISLAELTLLFGPFILLIFGLISQAPAIILWAGLSCFINILTHQIIIATTQGGFRVRGLINFPILVAMELWLINASMWRYEFREIMWKGRNICLPVMRVMPKLPSINQTH